MFELNENNKLTYKILTRKMVNEQNLEMVEIEHNITKAKIIFLICDDENRVFNIAFKTPVDNSKGTPHILEHSVLCGSRKYDVKDPFIELAKSSLNTFLNAMTFPDKTCYPVASANLKDFHNLVDVYLDAVFYPNVCRDDRLFKQEGWHYEIEDKQKPLTVNGVVYNEMKGYYSDPDTLLESAILETLYKGTNYEYESGGKPDEIPDLTYEEFVEFHRKYYSATNSIISYYGKLDYNYELEYLENEYLSNFEYVDCKAKFDTANNCSTDEEKVTYYNYDNDSVENEEENGKEDIVGKSYIAYSFLLDEKKTTLQNIIIQILDYILFSSDSAILKEKFLEEEFGEAVFSHYEGGLKNGFYSIVSQNIDENKKQDFISAIKNEINEIIKNGIEEDRIKSAINSLYFDYVEATYSMPKGLNFILTMLDTYIYGGAYETYIEYKEAFEYLRKIDLTDKNNIFIKTLKEIIIDNKYKCINILRPKCKYSLEKDELEAKKLGERKNSLSDDELDIIIKDMKELKDFQSTPDSDEKLRCVPKLKVSDIDRDKTLIDYKLENNNGVNTIASFNNDKDIVYLGIGFDVTNCTKEEIYLMSLFTLLIPKIDFTDESYKEFNNYIDLNSGGLSVKIDVYNHTINFVYRIKVMSDKLDIAFDIFYKLISKVIFSDSKRINILINEAKSNNIFELLSTGHVVAVNRVRSNDRTNSLTSWVSDKVNTIGVASNCFINNLSKIYLSNSKLINDTLLLFYRKVISSKLYFDVSTNEKYYDDVKSSFEKFNNKYQNYISEIKNEVDDDREYNSNIDKIKELLKFDDYDMKGNSEAIITPNDINFCAIANNFDKQDYNSRLELLKVMFNYEYLWTNIRVLGGAYGCASVFSRNGTYGFTSYRDPNLLKTNEVFYGVYDYLKNGEMSSETVNKYIIGAMGIYDNPISIYSRHIRNLSAYFNEYTDKMMNEDRHNILDTKPIDVKNLAKVFDSIKESKKCALICAKNENEAKKEYESVWKLTM